MIKKKLGEEEGEKAERPRAGEASTLQEHFISTRRPVLKYQKKFRTTGIYRTITEQIIDSYGKNRLQCIHGQTRNGKK